MKTKKRSSLRAGFVAMVLLCWVLPVVLLISISSIYVTKSVLDQTKNTGITSTQNAVYGVRKELSEAVSSSLAISYDQTVSAAWRKFRLDKNYVDFVNTSRNYLAAHYQNDSRFLASYFVFTQDTTKSFQVYNTVEHNYSDIIEFWKTDSKVLIDFSTSLDTQVGIVSVGEKMYLVRNLLDTSFNKYAIFILELNTDLIFGDIKNMVLISEAYLWINDTAAFNVGIKDTSELTRPINTKLQYGSVNNKIAVTGATIQPYYDLSFITYIDSSLIENQSKSVRIMLFGIAIILLPMLAYLFYFFYKRITKPIRILREASMQIEAGNFGLQLDADTLNGKEMGELGDSFNIMSEHLKKQFEQIYTEELALRDARIMALQSQINPHFLNNTLEIINWEARIQGDIKVCQMIEALSTMLSAAMDRRKRPLVHLSEELMYVDSYLYIIRERIGKRLDVIKQIDENTLDYNVPRLILQPIIENAVEHGISPNNHGIIYIRAYIKEKRLYLEIENNGKCTEEDLNKIKELLTDNLTVEGMGFTSLGIRNVHQRLRMLYGNDSGLLVKLTNEGNVMSQISINIEQDEQ